MQRNTFSSNCYHSISLFSWFVNCFCAVLESYSEKIEKKTLPTYGSVTALFFLLRVGRDIFKFTVHLVHATRVGERRALVIFQDLQKLADLAFTDNTNEQRFVAMRVHSFGVKSGNAAPQTLHQFGCKILRAVGDDLEFIATFKTLQHIIDDEVGDENIREG